MSPRASILSALALGLALLAWGVLRGTGDAANPGTAGLDVGAPPTSGTPGAATSGLRAEGAEATERTPGTGAEASTSSRRPGADAWTFAGGAPDLRRDRIEVPPYAAGPLPCLVLDPAGEPVEGARLVRVTAWHDTTHGAVREVRTDSRGLAEFDGSGDRRWSEDLAARRGDGPSVGLDATLADDGLRSLVGVTEADHPLTFVLPPHGELTVVLQGPGGVPWQAHTLLQLVPAGQETGPTGSPRHRWVRAEGGRATFPQVQAGLDLALLVDTFGERTRHPLRSLAAGEAREDTLHLGAQSVTARLLLVDGGGAPLADTAVVVSRSPPEAFGVGADRDAVAGRTDERGRLTLVLPPVEPGHHARTHHVTAYPGTGGPHDEGRRIRGWTLQGRFELPAVPAGRVVDLGRVVLEAPRAELGLDLGLEPDALLVRGVVVDPSGAPVGGARVSVATRFTAARRGALDVDDALATETDGAGRFELHRRVEGSLELRAEHSEHGSAAVPFTPGQELRVVLSRPGSLAGRVALPSIFPIENAELRLRAARGSAAVERHERRTKPSPDGTFRFDDLAPGTYDLELRSRDWNVPLRTLSRLEVPAGGPCPDERLAGVAPDAPVRAVELYVTSESGRPVPSVRVVVRPRGYAHTIPPTTFSGDRHTLVFPEGAFECEVEVAGHRRRVVPLEGDFVPVRLEERGEDEAAEPPLGPVPVGGGWGNLGGG